MHSKLIKFVVAMAMLASLGPSPAETTERASAELYDFMVQDVCLDGTGAVTSADPATCPSRRNIRLGEQTPYLLTDYDYANTMTYQAMNSFPVRGTDGSIKILYPKLNQGPFSPQFNMTSFVEARDGYDFADISHSGFASFVRTSDGGCFDQVWTSTGRIADMDDRAGGWALFPFKDPPSAWPATSSAIIRTKKVQLTKKKKGCGNGNSLGITFWSRPAAITFHMGKVLTAITSSHFANSNLSRSNNALERFYFTREYGFTRWEAWVPQSRCLKEKGAKDRLCTPDKPGPPTFLEGRCNKHNAGLTATGISGLDRWGNQNWVRVDCRDMTNHIALEKPTRLLTAEMANTNGLSDINLRGTTSPDPIRIWRASRDQGPMAAAEGNSKTPASTGSTSTPFEWDVTDLPDGPLTLSVRLRASPPAKKAKTMARVDIVRLRDQRVLASRIVPATAFTTAATSYEVDLPFVAVKSEAIQVRLVPSKGVTVTQDQMAIRY